jgi:hypothetical protein
MIISRENLATFQTEAQVLLEQHYQELTLHKEYIKLSVDWDKYYKLESAGGFVLITARDKGKLIGYSAFFISNHIHYKNTKIAMNDVLFLHKDYRKGSAGIKLIKESEKIMKELNVSKIIWHVKLSNDFTPILKRMGYVVEEVCVGKILKE